MLGARLMKGTPIPVVQRILRSDPTREEEPSGAWYVRGRNGKLWISRSRLRKADSELATLTIDEQTRIYPFATTNEEIRRLQENE